MPSHPSSFYSSGFQLLHTIQLSATEQCIWTGEPWSQLNSLLFGFGIVKCTKHPLLTGGNWCEIQHNNIGKGAILYMPQAWGSCAPFHYLWKVQGIQNVRCSSFCVCLRLELQWRDKQTEQSKGVLCFTPIPQRTLAQRTTCVHTRNILKLLCIAEMKKDYQAVPWFLH